MKKRTFERFPLNGTFELTARCNLMCKMCLIRIDHQRIAELGGRERTAEEWIHMAREVQEAGTLALLLTGGEPMLRPDFAEIYKEIARMGFILTVYTNATLVSKEIMEAFSDYPPHRIGITVYGASPDTYEKVCGNSGAYLKMLEGVEQLRQLPSQIILRTTIVKDNLEDLDTIIRWAFSCQKDVDFNISRIVTKPVRGGIAEVEACRLEPLQNAALVMKRNREVVIDPFLRLINDNQEIASSIELAEQYPRQEQEKSTSTKRSLYGCEAGMNSYTISWDGKLLGCQMLGDCWTYPFEEGFKQGWENFPDKVKIPNLPEQCIGCKISCSACPATRLAETGSISGWPEYLCKESNITQEMENKLTEELYQIINRKGRSNHDEL